MNLLTNPNFVEGHHHQDNIPEIVVPNGWYLYWIDREKFPGSESVAYRPESVVWNIIDAPEHEKTLFFLSGNYCWKVFKPFAPLYFAAMQKVSGLVPGTTYRFNAQVFPDIVTGYKDGRKVWPDDIWSAEARVGWSTPDKPWPRGQDGDINWSEWFNVYSENFEFGKYNDIWVEFTAPVGEIQVWLETKAKWGFENNWFMDAFTLEPMSGGPSTVTPPPGGGPTPPPVELPTHPKPGSGRGVPRTQYERIYFLLPKNLPAEMFQAAVKVAQDMDATVGFSPDDAGIGDLDERRVICVSPERIGTGMSQAWFDNFYPGVKFTAIAYASSASDLEAQLRAVFLA
ncbi:MAG: hypothetical protein JXA33_04465 [Anaerolineae bacterium]|nr:hypothetical protein [Anaerolineae bacterium]